MRRGRLAIPLAVAGAVVVAQAAVLLLRPAADEVVEPAPVDAGSYFSEAELDRAEGFRGPQRWLGLGILGIEAAALVWLVARPPKVLQRSYRRPLVAAAVAGAGVSLVLAATPLPVAAAARERAARERAERVRRALARLPEVAAVKRRNGGRPEGARTSTTDPDARVMKMADGGFRPAFNAQLATDAASGVVVGLDVTDVGSDHGLLGPMVRQLGARYGRAPAELLADGGFVVLHDIADLADTLGTIVYAPPTTPRDPGRDPFAPLPDDHPAVAAWRVRMGTDAAKSIYRQRGAAAECVNAQARNRGLQRFGVRGLARTRAVLLWFALAHNLARTTALRAARAAAVGAIA